MGLRVWGVGFSLQALGFRVDCLGCRVKGEGGVVLIVEGVWLRV